MLKRRRRIQKYISALKSKKQNLSKHTVLQYSLSSEPKYQLLDANKDNIESKIFGSSAMEKTIQTSFEFNQIE